LSVHDRVVKVISVWAHLNTPPNDTDQLKVLWAVSHQSYPFQPDAVRQLITALQNEFKSPPKKNVKLIPPDFDPGNIKTVDDAATAVGQMPGST
jgi:hypothetical protein